MPNRWKREVEERLKKLGRLESLDNRAFVDRVSSAMDGLPIMIIRAWLTSPRTLTLIWQGPDGYPPQQSEIALASDQDEPSTSQIERHA